MIRQEYNNAIALALSFGAEYKASALLHHKGDLITGDNSNLPDELRQQYSHVYGKNNICESILGIHDDLRTGRHIMDPVHAEGRVLAMKNKTFDWLLSLPDDVRYLLCEIG